MDIKKVPLKTVLSALIALPMQFLPLLLSGDYRWVEGWVFGFVLIFFAIASRVLAARKHPDLLAERSQYATVEGVKPWDRYLVPLIASYLPLAAYVVIGLDRRFGWSPPLDAWLKAVAFVVMLLGFALASWAFVENRFFSAVVRIQKDRGHVVCDTGPYRWVRHPGYAGGILSWLSVPFFMGSLWSFIPFGLTCLLIIVRTKLEDNTLRKELAGYEQYARTTRYRLLPGVW
ncbi:MAG: isoprenylcysteine carboxylmethyltransferase family protein [Anaerolineales bacterium]|nr:isoprenylcysteine carboxylmethyltransferase family protein [Anaerolineales bacterium]